MKQYKYLIGIIAVAAVISIVCLIFLKACGKDEENPSTTPPAVQSEEDETQTDIVVDQNGLPKDPKEKVKVDPYAMTDEDIDALLEPHDFPTEKPAEDEVESASGQIVGQGNYLNTQVLSTETPNGVTFYAGTNGGSSDDGIYLNLNCSEASDTTDVGYYVYASRGRLTTYMDPANLSPKDESVAACNNFYIVDRCFDNVIPADYIDNEKFGLCWQDDKLSDGQEAGCTVNVRAVDMSGHRFLGSYDITITRSDAGKYSISGIQSRDVLLTGAIDEETRQEIVEQAISFVGEKEFSVFVSKENWQETLRESAYVEQADAMYFGRFLDADGKAARITDWRTCSLIFPVTLSAEYGGYITIYFAPKLQVIGLDAATLPGETEYNLTLYAYDPFIISNEDDFKRSVPDNFFAF